jgi:peptidoglycan hydrolase-like amidase
MSVLRLNITLFFCLNLVLCGFGQSSNNSSILKGNVYGLIDDNTINETTVTIFYHNLSYTDKGQPITASNKDAQEIASLKPNVLGAFEFTIPLRTPIDYVFIKVTSPGYEPITKNLIKLTENSQTNINLALAPNNPTAIEEQLIEEKMQAFTQEKDIAKIKDVQALTEESIKKKAPTKNGSSSASDSVCSYLVPTSVFVSNLHNGYNGIASGNGYTGYIDFDLYVGGVVHGEIGGITTNLETKKAQAIAARTFSLNRHEQELPVNIGQAYHDTPTESSSLGSSQSSEQVILYNNQVIDAKYSARCNGDYTQSATEGTWSPYTTCNTYGNEIPYLLSITCSGHINCSQTSETPCCNAQVSTTTNMGYIYGHGVGMCQRGIEQFGELYGWTACQMITHYYTNVCIANTNCGNNTSNLICDNAIEISCGETYQGAASNATSNVFSYGCNGWTETGPERVHQITPTVSGTLTATITNFTGDLDVYLLGSCDPFDCLGTVYSSEVIFEKAIADSTYYIVIDADDGSGSGYDLFVNCSPTTNISNGKLNTSIIIYPNPSNGLIHIDGINSNAIIEITSLHGKTLLKNKINNGTVDISALPCGLYLITVYGKDFTQTQRLIKN